MTIVLTNKGLRELVRGVSISESGEVMNLSEGLMAEQVIAQLAAEVLRLRAERRRRIDQEEGDRG